MNKSFAGLAIGLAVWVGGMLGVGQVAVAAPVGDAPELTGQMAQAVKKATPKPKYGHLMPFNVANAPTLNKVVKVRFQTTAGELEIEVYPEAAPNAAERFLELVKIGFYDNTPIFRVVKTPRPFVAQFGINWREGMVDWKEKNFNDDPSLFHLGEGTLSFAKARPNINSTQVFINYGNNDFLREQTFSTFGVITKGLENAYNFKQVGDPNMGLNQQVLWSNGGAYLKQLPQSMQPTMILKAEIVEGE